MLYYKGVIALTKSYEGWERMKYELNLGPWNQVFAVPCVLVDRYMKLAGKEQLQVILWMFRHGGEAASPEDLAKALGISVEAAAEAVEYWEQAGILAGKHEAVAPVPQAQAPSLPTPAPKPVSEPSYPRKRMLRPDISHLAARMNESEDIRFLMQEAEATL